jgi:two-component system chemotaxis response regulator CheY
MPRILIIDDTDFDRNLLSKILRSAGYDVAGMARGGEEGIRMYREIMPDLVILDLIMPDLNGIETLRRIRSEYPAALVVICTTVDKDGMVELAKRLGARGYVVKPYQAVHILKTVERIAGPADHQKTNT